MILGKDMKSTFPISKETFQLKIIPKKIKLLPPVISDSSTYQFALFKGSNKIDETSKITNAKLIKNQISLADLQLNFQYNSFSGQNVSFQVKLLRIDKQKQEVANNQVIDVQQILQQSAQKVSQGYKTFFTSHRSKRFNFDLQIYIHRTKIGLENFVKKENKGQKSNIVQDQDLNYESKIRERTPIPDRGSPKRFKRKGSHRSREGSIERDSLRGEKQQSESSSARKGFSKLKTKQNSPQDKKIDQERLDTHEKKIQIKEKKPRHSDVSEMRSSRSLREQEDKSKDKIITKLNQGPELMYMIKMIVFIIISAFLIFNLMTPSKREFARRS